MCTSQGDKGKRSLKCPQNIKYVSDKKILSLSAVVSVSLFIYLFSFSCAPHAVVAMHDEVQRLSEQVILWAFPLEELI